MTTTTSLTRQDIPTAPFRDHLYDVASAQQAVDWLDWALRGVDRNAVDKAIVNGIFSTLGGAQGGAGVASLIERARQAERQTVVNELSPEDATEELLRQARADERATVEAEAAAGLAAARQEWATRAAKERADLQAAWSVVNSALSDH